MPGNGAEQIIPSLFHSAHEILAISSPAKASSGFGLHLCLGAEAAKFPLERKNSPLTL
jgi:hypothetical protein